MIRLVSWYDEKSEWDWRTQIVSVLGPGLRVPFKAYPHGVAHGATYATPRDTVWINPNFGRMVLYDAARHEIRCMCEQAFK
jgi:hypothetical protein